MRKSNAVLYTDNYANNVISLVSLPLIKQPNVARLRDGELVLYKRSNSTVWQARFKLYDKRWHSISTKHHNFEFASRAACEIYDEARFRERMGVSYTRYKFDAIAKATIKELEAEISAGIRTMTNNDYIRAINKYLIPFFGKRYLENIDNTHIREYEIWRNQLMNRVPLSSTLMTHASAYNRVVSTAVQRGWLSAQVPVAQLSRRGAKGKARPAFTKEELEYLLAFLEDYSLGGHSQLARDMRLLARDYIELLAATGMRSGKESLNIKWKHINWYIDSKTGKRYLRIWVSGKTGARYLIAKNRAEAALVRLCERQPLFENKTLDMVLAGKHDILLFILPDGTQPKSFHTTFIWLMKASGLLKDISTNQNRTLYSLRHTYATLAMLDNNIDIHTLAKQMGTSVTMLEKHYSKLTATLAAERLS
ncbi:integrase [Polynucleobacter sp. MWH-CaK5]|uniref:tyrosine-type recombinase/integrase n=1 Tax=Polynucleobacter sp. MWH-CaK5 TaxID=2689107 RepID=UPI00203AD905|nr:integrase [Polynucleobacter sp. MWH-CaK5]